MARKVVVELADDIDGSEANQTVSFGWQGVQYEIDLSDVHAKEFEAAISPYIESGRRVGGRRRRISAQTTGAPDGVDPKAVRQWAAQQGIAINSRGRVPRQLVEQYQQSA